MSVITPDEVVADYILQVSTVFRPKSMNVLGSFNVWKKGGWFGKADELMKFCPAPGCFGCISDTFYLSEAEMRQIPEDDLNNMEKWPVALQAKYENWFSLPVACPLCGTISIREQLPDSYGFNLPIGKIAGRMADFFRVLESNADIYMVRTKQKAIFQKARAELQSADVNFNRYRKLLEQGRDRDCIFYPLKSIIKDSVEGNVEARFKSLLGA